MKKKILLTLMVITLTIVAFGTISISAASSGTCGTNLTWTLNNGTLTINGQGDMDNWSYSANAPWYSSKANITKVVIGDRVTSIGDYAFNGFSRVANITIPDSITSIGQSAFRDCSNLTNIIITNKVTSVGGYAFNGCSSLTKITIGNSVTSIGEYAFWACNNLNRVDISDISAWCKISFVEESSNPLYKAGSLYLNGNLVTNLVIPKGITKIGDYAFYNCTSIENVTIDNTVTSIGSYAFSYCNNLTNATIGNSVTSIGYETFYYCKNLTSVAIGKGVTKIGGYAFGLCDNLNRVDISDVSAWCKISFVEESSNPLFNANNLYLNGNLVTNLIIPNGVKKISNYAFYNCTSINSITIPDSVTSIDEYVFWGCNNLNRIDISNISAWCKISFGGVSGNPLSYANNLYLNGSLVTDLLIPDSETSISAYAFAGCTNIVSVSIPNSVTSIGSYAFYHCANLTSIVIPDSVTSIGSHTFYSCGSLKNITIPNGITSIDNYLFFGCDSLTSITIPDGVTSIGASAFYYCEGLTNITFPDKVTSIGNSAFYNCVSLTSVTIPGSVSSIGSEAFYKCSVLDTVYYNGTADEWSKISIRSSNQNLTGATRKYFYYVTLIDMNGNEMSRKMQNIGTVVDISDIQAPDEYYTVLYIDKELTEEYNLNTPIEENLTLYIEYLKLNSIKIDGETTVDISEQGIAHNIYFATDKTSKYFSCTLKVPNSLAVQEIKSDIFDIEQDSETIGNDTHYYLFLIYNGDGNIPTYQTLNAFEVVFDVSENAVADENLSIEILDDAILADDDGNSYEFTSIGKAEIKINPILAEEITIVGADEIDKPTQYTVSVLPENTTNSNVEWSVSDEMIATISEDGLLTPVKKGNVTVRATAKDGSGIYDEKEVSVKVLGTVNSIATNIGLWDKEYSPNTTNYTIYVPETTTSIRLTAKHDGTFKTDKITFVNNVARTVTLSTTSDETVLDLSYTCDGYDDNKYTITIIKFEGTKTEVSEDNKSFTITPINVENGKTVILALYNGDAFVEMQSAVYTGEAIPFTITKAYTKAKVMVWNDLTNLKPVCDVEELN